ncbi:MAG: tRNA pseudouridine(38-40) synthase TruA [Acidobacteria bacterium]|nr:tRNA pseudouridine(38-40) synthase TruA [Acidobacteriota bacterium]
MRNIGMVLEYEGTGYRGWQRQAAGPTVQGTLTDALERITGERIHLIGSGRTDAGVHAEAQVANFHLERNAMALRSLQRALNSALPLDIRVKSLRPEPPGFHARKHARSKLYRYQVFTGAEMSPFLRRYYYHWTMPVNLDALQAAARLLRGTHDFRSFMGSGSAVRGTTRTVLWSEWRRRGQRLHYLIEASGFLRHMVRNIVGTLLEVGRGKMEPEALERILDSGRRTEAGPTAPAHGLFLVKVHYRELPNPCG